MHAYSDEWLVDNPLDINRFCPRKHIIHAIVAKVTLREPEIHQMMTSPQKQPNTHKYSHNAHNARTAAHSANVLSFLCAASFVCPARAPATSSWDQPRNRTSAYPATRNPNAQIYFGSSCIMAFIFVRGERQYLAGEVDAPRGESFLEKETISGGRWLPSAVCITIISIFICNI